MINADSVKGKLKYICETEGGTMQERLTEYALERSVYRISVSKYADRFTLKGGIFLYALFDGRFARATVDVDFLAQQISNDAEEIKKIFEEIFSIEYDDAIRYDLNSIKVDTITEFKKYHGVNVSVIAYLDRTKLTVSIDIGFGDVIYPERVKMDFPVLLEMAGPQIYAYSLSSVIAEKFEAIVSLGLANSRYKDFFDIYVLATEFDFAGEELKNAIFETFSNRKTKIEDIAAFEPGFAIDNERQKRWTGFIKRRKAMKAPEFSEVLMLIKCLLLPVVDAIANEGVIEGKWSHVDKKWIAE